jgi:hypothetical protein
MRNLTLKRVAFTLFFIAVIFSTPARAQSTVEELLLQGPALHAERNLTTITDELKALGGIEYVAFCPKMQVLMLKVDRRKQHNNQNILDVFTSKNYPVNIKVEVTISKIMNACEGIVLPGEQEPVIENPN